MSLRGYLHISIGGPVYSIKAGGKSWRFEQHPYFGPVVVGREDQEIRPPGPRSPFWRAWELWERQGRRVVDGEAVWEDAPEPRPKLRHLGGRQYEVAGWE